MRERRFEILDHTADAAIRAFGGTPVELFENAARAMFAVMFDLDQVPAVERRSVSARANSVEDLLVSWLKELLFLFETERVAFADFRVTALALPTAAAAGSVEGQGIGAPCAQVARRGAAVKAVTYHALRVQRDESGGWQAEVVFDV